MSEGAGAAGFDQIHKIPPRHRYFNVSTKFIPWYPLVIKAFYRLRIRHEVATALSIVSGLTGAWLIAGLPQSGRFLAAAVAVHLKDLFDATDGALARLTGTGHRLGRFIDTVGDGVVFTAWIAACAVVLVKLGSPVALATVLGLITWASLFLQCSWFNYYQLHYIHRTGGSTASRLDERSEDGGHPPDGPVTRALSRVYDAWFGWQDRTIAAWDRRLRRKNGLPDDAADPANDGWFVHKGFMVANSALCFGTHAFVLIVALLARAPHRFLPAVSLGMNLYLIVVASARRGFGAIGEKRGA